MFADSVLILGSAPMRPEDVRTLANDSDLVICADGGGDAALAAGIVPALILGDMDSLSSTGRSRLEAAGVESIVHPVDKVKTDLELALDRALMFQPSRITIAGGLGGERLDHTLGNVLLLALPALQDIDTRLVDASGEVFLVWNARDLYGTPGDYVSLLPLTLTVEGIVTTGLRFPLAGESLSRGSTRGVSNELLDMSARITIGSGCLLVRHELRRA
jgi:thiamine pyrophosphokinase